MKLLIWHNPFRIALILFVAAIVNHFFALSHEYWLMLAAFCASLINDKMPFRHSAAVVIIISAALILASIIPPHAAIVIFILLLLSGSYCLLGDQTQLIVRYDVLLFAFIVAIAFLSHPTNELLRERLVDVLIGGTLSFLISFLLFRFKPIIAFREGLVPSLTALYRYAVNLNAAQRTSLQQTLIETTYPNWVYTLGFNPGLRAGFRFFLLHLESVIDLYQSLQEAMEHQVDVPHSFLTVSDNNAKLIQVLQAYFEKNTLQNIDFDFARDFTHMEDELKKLVPITIELLDVSPQYLNISVLARIISDIHKTLLQLLNSLPAEKATDG